MRRFTCRSLGITLAVVGAFMLFAAPATTQDKDKKPTFGSVALKANFDPDPYIKPLIAGGPIQTKLGGFDHFVADEPDFVLEYTAGEFVLSIYAESPADTTLLIYTPDGKWVADDDGLGGNNPIVRFLKPETGKYFIWVGTFEKENAKALLKITELKK